ncbi:hypothetical protein V8J82_03065 [Gymnodinialimonas sp. 2305UL16-5]|uniref:hypothetical protein n=1 Tax=Gymnodinialimonas mytili TaxID=3126503 RepID=UPI00309A4B62
MDLTAQIDIYCERLGPGLWAEPLNALTNLAFLVGAIWAATAIRGRQPYAWALVVCLAAIGIGSGLFHTFATGWAALSDVIPILLFILIALFATARTILAWPIWAGLLTVALFFPYAAAFGALAALIPPLAISASYWPVALLIFAAALFLRHRTPIFARGLLVAGGLLLVSLTFRSVDMALCEAIPRGTHFLWHLFNGLLLAIVIRTYAKQVQRLETATDA